MTMVNRRMSQMAALGPRQPAWRQIIMNLKDELLLVAMLAFVAYLFFVVIIDKYS